MTETTEAKIRTARTMSCGHYVNVQCAECHEGERSARRELGTAYRDLELAIAHDRQPYPTVDAYERACAALKKHRERADHQVAEREADRLALASALLRSTLCPWPQLIALAADVQRENAVLWRQLEAVRGRDGMAPDLELDQLRIQVADAITAESRRRYEHRIPGSQEEHSAGFANAVMPIVVRLVAQRDETTAGKSSNLSREAVAPVDVVCRRCDDRGVVPDYTNWDPHRVEPMPKPCPDCQQPPNTGPLTGIEAREPCPYCTGTPMIPRKVMREHLDKRHAAVLEAVRSGLLDVLVDEANERRDTPGGSR